MFDTFVLYAQYLHENLSKYKNILTEHFIMSHLHEWKISSKYA